MQDGLQPQTPEPIDLHRIAGAFSFEEGFSRPVWRLIAKAIRESAVESPEINAAWNEAARQWVNQLRSDLGGDYRVSESQRFLLLAALDDSARARILSFAENTLGHIREQLREAAWNPKYGKHVILIFTDQDDYYQYVSYFHRDGIHPTSGGCLIHKDYVHIAMPYEPHGLRQTIAHELTHNCVVHLKLPLWLNMAFWNSQNIQEFWCGTSFQKPGDSNQLSYSLAKVLLNLLAEYRGSWTSFITNADPRDAGQTAAMDFLGADLGNVAATFSVRVIGVLAERR